MDLNLDLDHLNDTLNDFVAQLTGDETINDDAPHGKPVPFIGWYWRNTDFAGGRIPLGWLNQPSEGLFCGVMENNKWGYRERLMTDEEVAVFVRFLVAAKLLYDNSTPAQATTALRATLQELRNWMYALPFSSDPTKNTAVSEDAVWEGERVTGNWREALGNDASVIIASSDGGLSLAEQVRRALGQSGG